MIKNMVLNTEIKTYFSVQIDKRVCSKVFVNYTPPRN